VFSRADYELASRMLGLPMPETPDEQAAAAPMVAYVMRTFAQGGAPRIEGEPGGMYTGATRSLNTYPDVDDPMGRAQLQARLRVEQAEPPAMDPVLVQLLDRVCENPEMINQMLQLLAILEEQSDEHMDELSAQRPAEYDTPNLGANYSMLNAPSSNGIPPSVNFQQLS